MAASVLFHLFKNSSLGLESSMERLMALVSLALLTGKATALEIPMEREMSTALELLPTG